jgi:hypothetical protein
VGDEFWTSQRFDGHACSRLVAAAFAEYLLIHNKITVELRGHLGEVVSFCGDFRGGVTAA